MTDVTLKTHLDSLITAGNMASVIGIYESTIQSLIRELEETKPTGYKGAILEHARKSLDIGRYIWEHRNEGSTLNYSDVKRLLEKSETIPV